MPRGTKTPGEADAKIVAVLLRAMDEAGVTRAEISRRMTISEGQVSRIFALIRPMTIEELAQVCDILGVSIVDVLRDAGL